MKRHIYYLTCLAILIWPASESEAFWLTDANLFEPREVIAISTIQNSNNSTSSPTIATSASPNLNPSIAQIAPQTSSSQLNSQQFALRSISTKNNDVQSSANQCSCDPSWLHNETSQWLSKWLQTSQASDQLRLVLQVVSNSTGATRLDQNLSQNNQAGGGGRRRSPQLAADSPSWTSKSRASNLLNSLTGNFSHWSASPSRKSYVSSSTNNNINAHNGNAIKRRHQAAEPSAAHAAAAVGPQGPKGEQGPRGERGESGLTSVKDREALFQLEHELKKNKQQFGTIIGRLVFVESEQFLVIGTTSGWRQLLLASSPLRDFKRLSTNPRQMLSASKHRAWLQLNSNNNKQTITSGRSVVAGASSGREALEPRAQKASSSSWQFYNNNNNNNIASSDSESDIDNNINRNNINIDSSHDNRIPVLDAVDDSDATSNAAAAGDDKDDEDDDDIDDGDEDAEDDDEGDDEEEEADSLDSDDENNSELSRDDEDVDDRDDDLGAKIKLNRSKWPSYKVVSSKPMTISTPRPSPIISSPPASSQKQDVTSPRETSNQIGEKHKPADVGQLQLRMIALNEPYSGKLHGVRGADFECKRQAAKANIKGSFRSFLASGGQNLADLVRPSAAHKNSIVNLRGEQLANSWTALLRQPSRLTNPLSRVYSFDGRHVATDSNWPNKLVWHGAQNKHGLRDPTNNCDGWHSDGLSKFGTATPLHNPRNYLSQQQHHINHAHQDRGKLRKAKRFSANDQESRSVDTDGRQYHDKANVTATSSQIQVSTMFIESVEKFPCRMPLIVYCIETVARPVENTYSRREMTSSLISNRID